ncbi:HlyD family secretion protein [Daejeonella lutea]|uniref:HlyD family secretion protein n=1 Tax=Daejeonella lutea TaxID=572036 RepID=A0A1T5BSN9_9SPHI|nr:HlyD family secretion protein [Daejeonella lutea]SKB50197.1 HlyD family secretion protein [Daejeonella lutea]
MERDINKKKWVETKIPVIVGALIVLACVAAALYFASGIEKLAIEKSFVKKGAYQETVAIDGIVMPLAAVQLDASEGGRVVEILVSEGDYVNRGQAILRLSNTDLQTSLANQETAVLNVLSKMQSIRNSSDQNSMRQLNQLAEVENALAEAERVYNLNKYLFAEKAIGSQELKSYENSYKYQLKRLSLTREALSKDSASVRRQLRQMENIYNRMQSELAELRQKSGNMIVRSPVDGQLRSVNARVGQVKGKGESLGQVDIVSGYKIRVGLSPSYKQKVFEGMKGSCTVDGINYRLLVHKVYPEVVNDRFHMDMVFEEKVPVGLRSGGKLSVQLSLIERLQAFLFSRPAPFSSTGRQMSCCDKYWDTQELINEAIKMHRL